ncbi:MAG: Lrp/AsnC ligand binding domain-containing protein [Thaumarchaeota archaeon]|nr:Lrp/AsnC ligand binding domain-containing protein [Nitrososphaerota archaeon]
MRGYVLFNTKPGTSEEVLKSLRESRALKGMVSADSVFGRFDAILVIEAKDLEEFGDIVYQVIEKNPSIIHTETCVALPSGE